MTSNSASLVNDRERDIYMVANYVFVTAAISLCGLVANIINIIVFFKQGFNSTVNITFFGIAISDLVSLLGLLWGGVCVNPLFINSDVNIAPLEILHLTSGIPHICFVRITGWLTVFITAERCLCIILPLKIKQIITPNVTIAIVSLIYIAIMLSFAPEFEIAYFDWKFYPEKNKTLLGLMFTNKKTENEGIVFFLYSVLGTISFVAVILFTVILVQLRRKSEWRSNANLDKLRTESISNRDRKTMIMVVFVAVLLIGCYSPGVAVSMATFFEPELRISGRQVNLFYVAWTFAFIFEAINSSINIFVYYKMSSKYRETFRQMCNMPGSHNPQGEPNNRRPKIQGEENSKQR